jgi:probable F420-dependent oxidoreductase
VSDRVADAVSGAAAAPAGLDGPVRFGIQGSGQHTEGRPDPGLFRAVADLAEGLGWDSIWGGEHLSFHNPILDLSVALSIFAARTERLLLGAGLVLLPLRHPSWVAKTYGSIDFVSGGRLLLGVGVGGEGAQDFAAAGVPIGERGARADEAIAAVRELWRAGAEGRPASHDGRFYPFQGVSIDPPPARPGGPPLLVGGRTPAALRRAGRLGDGWLAYMVSAERFARDFAEVRRHAAEAGRDPAALTPAIVLPAHVSPDGEAAREQARAHLSERYNTPFEPHHVARYAIAGDPDECRARLREYLAAGVRHFVLNPAGPAAAFLDEVEALHDQVVAPLRAEPAPAAAGPPAHSPSAVTV